MVEVKYPVLKPKESISAKMAMSKIHISRNWKLPPLRSRDKCKRADSVSTTSDVSSPEIGDDNDMYSRSSRASKKKIQNREAQRAYRERSKNKLQALEENVEALQDIVRSWQNKYKKLAKEYDTLKAESTRKIAELEKEVEGSKDDKRCFICMKNVDLADIKQNARDTELKPLFMDEFLNQAIENFKPIPAVSIKPTQNAVPPTPHYTTKQTKKLSDILPKSVSSTPPPTTNSSEGVSLSPQPPAFSSTTLGEDTLDVEKEDCGFCHDNTTCFCRDLNASTGHNHKEKKKTRRSSMLLLDALPQAVDSVKTKYTESAMRSTSCTENPSKCQKCTDIDKSCIKPIEDDLLPNGSSKRRHDVLDDLPMEFEIDVTDFMPKKRKK